MDVNKIKNKLLTVEYKLKVWRGLTSDVFNDVFDNFFHMCVVIQA